MVDVDHFKAFNDTYGHPEGDACLRDVARALKGACLRPSDLVSRYGGEEFAVLLPHTPAAGAEHLAQRVLAAVARLGIPHVRSSAAAHVTVSVGVGTTARLIARATVPDLHAGSGPNGVSESWSPLPDR